MDIAKYEDSYHWHSSLPESSIQIVNNSVGFQEILSAARMQSRGRSEFQSHNLASQSEARDGASIKKKFNPFPNQANSFTTNFFPCMSEDLPCYSRQLKAETIGCKLTPCIPGDNRGIKIASQRLAVQVNFTRDLLDALRGMSLPRAASAVGVSATAFKKACRRLGVARWEYMRGPGQRRKSDRGNDNADDDTILQACSQPVPCPYVAPYSLALLGSGRDLPVRRPAVTPARLDFKPSISGPPSARLPTGRGTSPASPLALPVPQHQPGTGSSSASPRQWGNAASCGPAPLRPDDNLNDVAGSESGSGELTAPIPAGGSLDGVPPAPPQPARLELGWPDLGGETEGWADGGAGLDGADSDDALVLAMLARPWPEGAPCGWETRPPSESESPMGLEWPATPPPTSGEMRWARLQD